MAIVSPARSAAAARCFCASVPAFMIAVAASTVEAKYGAQSSARPISSSTMPSSTKPKPWPPYSSGMWTPVRPSCWLSSRQPLALPAGVGLHQPPHHARRRLLLQEAPQHRAELFLLAGEAELHAVSSPYALSPASRSCKMPAGQHLPSVQMDGRGQRAQSFGMTGSSCGHSSRPRDVACPPRQHERQGVPVL